jgi:hypothetical protein
MRYFNPEYLEEQDQDNKLQNYNPSELESALRGAAQSATLGFADEMAGGAGVLFDRMPNESLQDAYIRHRDESRAKFQKAQEVNPKSYMAGEIGGNVATMAIPGLGAAKSASLAKNALQAAKLGALAKLGTSENLETAPQEMLEGAIGGLENVALGALAPKPLLNVNKSGKIRASNMEDILESPSFEKVKDLLNRPGNESLKEAILNFKRKELFRKKLGEEIKQSSGVPGSGATQVMHKNYLETGVTTPSDKQIEKAQEFAKNIEKQRPLSSYSQESQEKAMNILTDPERSLPEKEAFLRLLEEIRKRSK